jgi:hypothetical protein
MAKWVLQESGGCKCDSHPNLPEKLGLLNFTEP